MIRLRFQNQVFAWTLDLESWEVLRLILTLRLGSFFLASATPSNPASMNGIWKLVGINESSLGKPRLLTPAGELSVHHKQRPGGCGRFTKILTTVRNVLHIEIVTPPPPPKKRSLHAVRGTFDDDMNAATQYVLSSRYFTVFSQTARLTFERIGFVTPANK